MKTSTIQRTPGLLTGLLLAGLCAHTAHARAKFTEEIHQTYPITADGRISLDNVNSAVGIAVWDRAEVKLDAVKRAKEKEHLEAVKIEIEAKPDRLQVHTKYPESKGWFGRHRENSVSVDYTLTVPRSARLDPVSTVNGTLEIDGVRGKVQASSVNGALKARGLVADTQLSSVNGGLSIHLATSAEKE